MKKLFALLIIFISQLSFAQADSCNIRISLLTCTPGEELYSTFGHSAIRAIDKTTKTDIVFNYGTFDFYDPNFYKKFIKGKLLYFVSTDSLAGFLSEYEYYKRGVTEQVLNLSCAEKQNMLAALFENSKEENKYYRYDFNYDNCTTRLRDMVEKISGNLMQTKNILPHNKATFRTLIHDYLNKGGQQWSKLGIDILLGAPLDKKITNREAMFLPEYLLKAFDSSGLNDKILIAGKNILLPAFEISRTKPFLTPFVVFSIFFLLIALISFLKQSSWNKFFTLFDFIFFFLLGLIGALLLFMWFGTNHAMCKNNFNLLWALPVHLLVAFMLFSKKKWVSKYFKIVFWFTLALIVVWFFLPQQFNISLLPVTGIILLRSYFRSKQKKSIENSRF